MTDDLAEVRSSAVPRPDPLCARLAKRIDPAIGFILFAVVWLFVVVPPITLGMTFGAIGISRNLLGLTNGSTAGTVIVSTAMVLGLIICCVLFARWCGSRRARARVLVREGALCPAIVGSGVAYRGMVWCKLEFEHEGLTRRIRCSVASGTAPQPWVLYHPGSRYTVGFNATGKAVACARGKA